MVPLAVDELTAQFFSYALDRDVLAAELLDNHWGTTGRAKFALRGAPGIPATVFVKLAPPDENQRTFVTSVGMGISEARFYRDLAAEVPVRVPHPWFAEVDGDRFIMVLEDLEAAAVSTSSNS